MPLNVTYYPRGEDIEKKWVVIDAADKVLGRLATLIANRLKGKEKVIYTPSVDTGDYVIVINASKICLTGNKKTDKLYYRYSGYPGGLKIETCGTLLNRKAERLVYLAVKRMLPSTRFSRKLLTKLKIYPDQTHPHSAQNPQEIYL